MSREDKAIHALLAGPRWPDREFVCSGKTFAEVYALAAELLVLYAQVGCQGQSVCLAAEDKALIAAALLASLAGGPVLLLPYAFSRAALARLHKTAPFRLVLADAGRDFPPGVELLWPQRGGAAARPLQADASPGSELLRIFTGGSTGAPQLWSKTAANLFGEALFLADRYAFSEQDRILATVPPCHIYGLLFSVVLPLVAGAAVVGATPSFPHEIVCAAAAHKATVLVSVPAHYRILQDRNMALRLAFSSAGMLDAADNEAFCRQHPAGITEVYGSTETGGIATRNRAQGEECFTPFATIDWRIRRSRLRVRSPYISPELPLDSEGCFLTNDRAEACGTAGFLLKGRMDAVAKVGGKRVDLAEIALLIREEPGVTDCAVTALSDPGGRGHRIRALIAGEAVNLEQIRKALAAALEPYAMPRLLRAVAQIPVKATGKRDWAAIARLLQDE
jgi:acyl-coenzyme A synthetase/AMP-(fatty) acid ligase